MDIIQSVVSKVAIMLLIYLIINRALSNLRKRKKAFIIFLVGIFLSGIFLIVYFIDKQNPTKSYSDYVYFTYIITNFVFAIFYLIYGLTLYRKNEFINYNFSKRKDFVPTSRVHYKKFLYLVFEYKNEYLFKKHKETYSGTNFRLKKGEFHDVEIGALLKKFGAQNSKVTEYGEYTNTKTKEIYYIYLINLDKEINIKNHEFVFYSKIRFLEMSDFDKGIIYRVLINERIDIEV